jgi:hypothetical protein
MALSADSARLGATTDRILNKLAFAIANKASDIGTATASDILLMFDASADYEAKYADSVNLLEMLGEPNFSVTSASTDGGTSVEPFVHNVTMTGAGGVGGRARFELDTNVILGSWANALKAQIEFGATGGVTGLGSAFVAEMILSAGTASGSYAPLEIELGLATGALTGTRTSFISMNVYGDDAGTMDDNGFLFDLNGVTAGAGDLFASNAKTGIGMTHTLKCQILGTTYFIALHTSANFGGS